jgi:predicted nucleotidyltransferase
MVRTKLAPTLAELRQRREEILRIVAAHGAANVRVFGSVARGEADSASDVDFLVDVVSVAKGFRYFEQIEDLRRALTALLGYDINVLDAAALRDMRGHVLRNVVAL